MKKGDCKITFRYIPQNKNLNVLETYNKINYKEDGWFFYYIIYFSQKSVFSIKDSLNIDFQ